jgi:hypothetical protein
MNSLHLVWSILPAYLFFLTLKTYFQKISGSKLREYTGHYFKQALITAAILLFTIWLDNNFVQQLAAHYRSGSLNLDIPRFLLYPIVLVVLSTIHNVHHKRKLHLAELEKEKKRARFKKF